MHDPVTELTSRSVTNTVQQRGGSPKQAICWQCGHSVDARRSICGECRRLPGHPRQRRFVALNDPDPDGSWRQRRLVGLHVSSTLEVGYFPPGLRLGLEVSGNMVRQYVVVGDYFSAQHLSELKGDDIAR